MRTCVTASTHQACVCVMVLGVCVSVSANTLSVRVCVCVNYGCVCERQHAHITIERLLWQLLPRRLQCYLVYGRRHLNTCPIFPQSPSHGIGPRISTGTTAAKWHLGRLFLQLLPLVSNKHLISLSQSNRGFSFSASHLIWILASPPGIAGFRAGRPAARDPAEVVTSVLLGTHEHTRKTNCLISADQALHPVRT